MTEHMSASMKRITRRKAMEIASNILEQAEMERLQIAEEEAKRGIDWRDYGSVEVSEG